MAKLGTKARPIIFRAATESRTMELVELCNKRNWIFIAEIGSNEPEDISQIEYMLNPAPFNFVEPKSNKKNTTVINTEKQIGRNDNCTCGSGLKFKKCCMK